MQASFLFASLDGSLPQGYHYPYEVMTMKELLDLVDKHGKPLNLTIVKGDPAPQDAYWRVCDAWFVDAQGRLLLQKRADAHLRFPGMWCCTGGAVRSGETPAQGCIRECQEELGLTPDMNRGDMVMEFCASHSYHYIWLFRQNIPPEALCLQSGEVSQARWFTVEEVRGLIRRGEFVPLGYTEQLLMMLPILCACGKE